MSFSLKPKCKEAVAYFGKDNTKVVTWYFSKNLLTKDFQTVF